MPEWEFVDLYSGGGGLSLGALMAGGTHIAGLDNDDDAGAVTHYQVNIGNPEQFFDGFDLSKSPDKLLKPLLPNHGRWILIGGPPCKSFSIAGLQDPNDERSKHVQNFMRYVKELNPPGFFFENVPNIFGLRNQKPKQAVEIVSNHWRFKALEKYLQETAYKITPHVLIASEFGTPQNRIRVFFTGVRNGNTVQEPTATHYVGMTMDKGPDLFPAITVRDAISDLPKTLGNGLIEYDSEATHSYQKWARGDGDGVTGHLDTKHKPETQKLIDKTPIGEGVYDYNHSWIKFDPDKPSKTIKMNNRAPGIHWKRNQCLSPRECARLQGFPDSFTLLGTKTKMLNVIGNAVPPQLASAVCTSLIVALKWSTTKS